MSFKCVQVISIFALCTSHTKMGDIKYDRQKRVLNAVSEE